MTKEGLLKRLNDIEWDDIEVKEATGGIPKSMRETVSAFYNTPDSWIILGIKEVKIPISRNLNCPTYLAFRLGNIKG